MFEVKVPRRLISASLKVQPPRRSISATERSVSNSVKLTLFKMFRKCCVPQCNSMRQDVKLHRFPVTGETRVQWLHCINSGRISLSISDNEVRKAYVCHKHFEKRFVNVRSSHLKVGAYPSLFTASEISSGNPSKISFTDDIKTAIVDHTYTRKRHRHIEHAYALPVENRPIKDAINEVPALPLKISAVSQPSNKNELQETDPLEPYVASEPSCKNELQEACSPELCAVSEPSCENELQDAGSPEPCAASEPFYENELQEAGSPETSCENELQEAGSPEPSCENELQEACPPELCSMPVPFCKNELQESDPPELCPMPVPFCKNELYEADPAEPCPVPDESSSSSWKIKWEDAVAKMNKQHRQVIYTPHQQIQNLRKQLTVMSFGKQHQTGSIQVTETKKQRRKECTFSHNGSPLKEEKQKSGYVKPTMRDIKKNLDKTPQLRHLMKKLNENRKLMRSLRKQANLINSIKSPFLKTLISSIVANQNRKPRAKRWPQSIKTVALDIFKRSSSAYKYVSEVFQLPNFRTLRKIPDFDTGIPLPQQVKKGSKDKENALCELLLNRINKFTENPVEDTRTKIPLKMKILIKGDRNIGKSCLLQRLQGGPFIEEYVPTEQIQVAPIHWTHKNSDHIVNVEVWEVVDKGRAKKKPPLGLKLENQTVPSAAEDGADTPVLDATFLDVYKNASGVILMMDITKPWTFEYVVKELSQVPSELPVVILGNHCDMQHHRQVHPHHIDQALHQAKLNRSGPVRYAESSMRNGFGLRLLHKFLSVPFLQLQRASLLEQLQRCQRDAEDMEREIDDFQNSEEAHYNAFVDRLASKRRETAEEARPSSERSPSIIVGAGRPIVPPAVNSLSLNAKPKATTPTQQKKQHQFIYPELLKSTHAVSMETTPPGPVRQDSGGGATVAGALDEFYAGTLDSSFLDDVPVAANQEHVYDTDSDDGDTANPMVTNDQDDLDENFPTNRVESTRSKVLPVHRNSNEDLNMRLKTSLTLSKTDHTKKRPNSKGDREHTASQTQSILSMPSLDNDFTPWAGDSSARRSPEGGEDSDVAEKSEKKLKKKKPKDKGDYSEKSERKKLKKSKIVKTTSSNAQSGLLAPGDLFASYEEYDSF